MTDERTAQTERELRALLTERSGVPSGDPHPVATLQRRHRRRQSARVGATGVTTAVAVVALVFTPRLLEGPDRGLPPVGPGRSSTASAAGTTSAGPAPTAEPSGSVDGAYVNLLAVRYLETSGELRARLTDTATAEVRCAVDRRRAPDQPQHVFVWARCKVVSGDIDTAVSLPVRLTYDASRTRFAALLMPDDGPAYSETVKKHFPGDTAKVPDEATFQRMQAEIDLPRPRTDSLPSACADRAAVRTTGIYVATIRALLEDELDRGPKRIYVLREREPGPGGDVPAGVSPERGDLPAAVARCLAIATAHRLPITVVDGPDDPAIARHGTEVLSPVRDGVVVSLSAVGPGDAVQVAASADFGGGKNMRGGVFEVTRGVDTWRAVATGVSWIA
jgi:hypothetical protein